MEDFSRSIWVSQYAKDLWQPRISRIASAWNEVEARSVFECQRRAALQIDNWPKCPKGFVTIGVGTQVKAGSYLARSAAAAPGQPFSIRTVTARTEDIKSFIYAWTERDDDAIGLMLGYPPCCIHFFGDTWSKGLLDPTEKMEVNGLVVDPETNILLRWIGVRPVPHMPCSTSCPATKRQGRLYLSMLPSEERDWAYELLGMNFKYSTLNGVAEISTPIFKLAVGSQGTRDFRLLGNVPDGTVGGARFPFIEDIWTNNGFIGPTSMCRAHEIVRMVIPLASRVIDFGCGNGWLLSQIKADKKVGIDMKPAAIIQGRVLDSKTEYIIGNMFELRIPQHDLSLISLERLTETDNPVALIGKLADNAVIYSYSDGQSKFHERRETFFSDWAVVKEAMDSNTHAALIQRKPCLISIQS